VRSTYTGTPEDKDGCIRNSESSLSFAKKNKERKTPKQWTL
jgi:hypothetical protein